ncbi:MAG: DUF2341 domain-containing protein [Kofleriaceae bacterium]|nr:DUF2341 domain-containing protein [Kofleriaceae bacterium]
MRWLPLVVLAGCSFSHGSAPLTSDAQTSDDDGSVVMDPDAGGVVEIDAPPPDPTRVRAIALSGAQVIGGPHANFPLLVSLSATWLRPRANGGDVSRADGFDIYFSSDQAGAMKLAHEVESYVPASGELIAWVKVPSLTASTTIYIHYGDPGLTTDPQNVAGVWSANYQGVFHLDSAVDSTGKNTAAAMTSGTVAGRIGKARSFDGADDVIDLGSASAIDNLFSGGGTAEAWFYATTWGESSHGRIFDKGHDTGWSLWVDNVEVQQSMGFLHGGGGNSWGFWSSPAQSVTLNAWHHVAVVYNKNTSGNNATLYLDGSAVTTTRIDNPSGTMDDDSSHSLGAGNRAATDRAFEGMLDELRLSSSTRSAGWIETGFRNQSSPGTFYTVSAPL